MPTFHTVTIDRSPEEGILIAVGNFFHPNSMKPLEPCSIAIHILRDGSWCLQQFLLTFLAICFRPNANVGGPQKCNPIRVLRWQSRWNISRNVSSRLPARQFKAMNIWSFINLAMSYGYPSWTFPISSCWYDSFFLGKGSWNCHKRYCMHLRKNLDYKNKLLAIAYRGSLIE